MVGGWGECLVEHCTFQNRNPVRVFLYHCFSDGNQLFSENFGCHFHFILHIMSDKAAFVSGALLCVRYRGNLKLYHSNSASCWQRINLHIYAATNSVTVSSHRRRRERQSGRKSFIFNVSQRRAPARAARRVLDGEGVEESWNQVNFMVMSYDAVRRQPIGM